MANRANFNRGFSPNVGEMIAMGLSIKAVCDQCKCEKAVDLKSLAAIKGPRYSLFNRRCRCKLLPGCEGWNRFLHNRSGIWLGFHDPGTAARWISIP